MGLRSALWLGVHWYLIMMHWQGYNSSTLLRSCATNMQFQVFGEKKTYFYNHLELSESVCVCVFYKASENLLMSHGSTFKIDLNMSYKNRNIWQPFLFYFVSF